MAYTLDTVKSKGHTDFLEARHSGGYFERVWGVHPLADVGGSDSNSIEIVEATAAQTIIEGVSRAKNWPSFLYPLNFLVSQAILVRLLLRTIREERIDVIVTTDAVYSGLFGVVLKIFSRRPLVVGIFANYDLAYETHGFLAMPRLIPWRWLQNIISALVLRSCDFVVGGNRDNLAWGIKHGADETRSEVFPLARSIQSCHLQDPVLRPSPAAAFAALGIPQGKHYLIMVSRLLAVKFAEDGVRAMMIAASKDEETIGIVAGDGPMRGELEQLVAGNGLAKRIIFVGNIDQARLSEILPHAITISPLTGMALVEAGLGGSPAIAYDADWQAEFIEDGVNGFIVPTGDYGQLGEKAAALLADPSLRQRMSLAIRAGAEAFADRDKVAAIEFQAFDRVLGRSRPRSKSGPEGDE